MTLKHIGFIESEVMRELVRQAHAKGEITPDLGRIVEAAKSVEDQLPTDNLLRDMVALAEALHKKGLTKQAVSLEEKIVRYSAEKTKKKDWHGGLKFNPIFEEAHPEGEVEKAQASDGLGVVETVESQHNKIMEVMNKKLSPRLAAQQQVRRDFVKQILISTAETLKLGQGTSFEEVEEVTSGKRDEDKKKIETISSSVINSFKSINEALATGVSDVKISFWNFTYDTVSNGPDQLKALYAKKAGVDYQKLSDYYKKVNNAFGQKTILTEKEITSKLYGLPYAQRYTYVNSIFPEIASAYCEGSPTSQDKKEYLAENPDQASISMFRDKATSLWTFNDPLIGKAGVVMSVENTNKLGKIIYDKIVELGNSLVSSEKIKQASVALQADINIIISDYLKAYTYFSSPPSLDKINVESVIIENSKNKELLVQYMPKGARAVEFSNYALIVFPEWAASVKIYDAATSAVAKIDTLTLELSKIGGPQAEVVQDVQVAAGSFMAAARNFAQAVKADPKSPKAEAFKTDAQSSYELAQIVAGGKGKPYGAMFQDLVGVFPNAKTFKDLEVAAKQWLAASAQVTKGSDKLFEGEIPVKASRKDQLTKLAAPKPMQSATMPASVPANPGTPAGPPVPPSGTPAASGKPSGIPSTKAPTATYQGTVSDEEKAAVQTMQYSLQALGKSLENEPAKSFYGNRHQTLLTVGKNQATDQDGVWWKWTNDAVLLAQLIMNEFALKSKGQFKKSVLTQGLLAGKSNCIQAAKANTQALNELIKTMFGVEVTGGPNAAKDLDYLPSAFASRMSEMEQKSGSDPNRSPVKVTTSNLNGMYPFYKFLITNGMQATTAKNPDPTLMDKTGLTLKQWRDTILWFFGRAKWNYSQATDDKDKSRAELYHSYIGGIQKQFAQFIHNIGGAEASQWDKIVISEKEMASLGGTRKVEQGQSNGKPGLNRPGGSNGSDNGEDLDGTDGNLSGPGGSGGNWMQTLPFNARAGEGGTANGNINLKLPWYQAIFTNFNMEGRHILSYEGFRTGNAKDMAHSFFDDENTNKDPLKQYEMFLNALRKSLREAVRSWSKDKNPPPEAVEKIGLWSEKWNEILSRQLANVTSRT